jgi:hypothetical protein
VDYDAKQATIGTAKGRDVPKAGILKALEEIKYQGAFIDKSLNAKDP